MSGVFLVLLLEPKVPSRSINQIWKFLRDPASNGGAERWRKNEAGDPLGLSGTGTSSYKVKKVMALNPSDFQ